MWVSEDNVYGIDFFVGVDNFNGKGYGRKVLRKITEYIFEKTSAEKMIVYPILVIKGLLDITDLKKLSTFPSIENGNIGSILSDMLFAILLWD